MDRNILIITVEKRKKTAHTVQNILTEWGCRIKTRLGIHDGVLDDCSNKGLIILELVGETKDHLELARKLDLLEGVQTRVIEL